MCSFQQYAALKCKDDLSVAHFSKWHERLCWGTNGFLKWVRLEQDGFVLQVDAIREYWSFCGEIEDLDVMRFPDTGRFKGIAFITYATVSSHTSALTHAWHLLNILHPDAGFVSFTAAFVVGRSHLLVSNMPACKSFVYKPGETLF